MDFDDFILNQEVFINGSAYINNYYQAYGIVFNADSAQVLNNASGFFPFRLPNNTQDYSAMIVYNSIMNVASGFTQSLSFYFTNVVDSNPNIVYSDAIVRVFSELDGAGCVLAQVTLPITPDYSTNAACEAVLPNPLGRCPLELMNLSFGGTAKSVQFYQPATTGGFVSITLGSTSLTPSQ